MATRLIQTTPLKATTTFLTPLNKMSALNNSNLHQTQTTCTKKVEQNSIKNLGKCQKCHYEQTNSLKEHQQGAVHTSGSLTNLNPVLTTPATISLIKYNREDSSHKKIHLLLKWCSKRSNERLIYMELIHSRVTAQMVHKSSHLKLCKTLGHTIIKLNLINSKQAIPGLSSSQDLDLRATL
jgi:hypothetical protein